MLENRVVEFMSVYKEELAKAVKQFPNAYVFTMSELPKVLERMEVCLRKGTVNIESRAMRATFKRLGIKHTYKALKEFLDN